MNISVLLNYITASLPWKALPGPKHPQKAKLKDSGLQKKTLKTTVKKYNSAHSSSIQNLKCITVLCEGWEITGF